MPEFVEIREISLFHYLIWFCYVLLQSNEKNLTKEKTKKIELKKNDLTNGDFQNLLSLIKIFKKSLNHFFSENSQAILIPLLTGSFKVLGLNINLQGKRLCFFGKTLMK